MIYCKQLNSTPYDRECYLVIASSCKDGSKFIDETFTDHFYKDKLYKEKEKDTTKGYQTRCRIRNGDEERSRFFIVLRADEIFETTVEHELIHLTWDILNYCSVEITADNHEAMTFLFEHLLNQTREYIIDYQEITEKSKKKK